MAEILLVEDDEMISRMLTLRLQLAGHSIEQAENGQQALEHALGKVYDLILMDMHMPVMDGHQATQRLREAGYRGLIIAVTASALSQDCEKAIQSGCDHHIAKPIGPEFEQQIMQLLTDQQPG